MCYILLYVYKLLFAHRYSRKAGMGEKGFLMQSEFTEKGVKFYQPTFLGPDRPQYELEEVLQSEEIASVRIHVERIIHMIRQFHILRGNIPLTMKPLLEQIFTVCAYLTNFQTPFVEISFLVGCVYFVMHVCQMIKMCIDEFCYCNIYYFPKLACIHNIL